MKLCENSDSGLPLLLCWRGGEGKEGQRREFLGGFQGEDTSCEGEDGEGPPLRERCGDVSLWWCW